MGAHEISKTDLAVDGSVAVDAQGHRLGKGGGCGDVEINALKKMFRSISVITVVYDIHVIESVPFNEKDEKVSIIVTPTKIIRI